MKALVTGAAGNLGTALVGRAELDIVPFGRADWPRLDGLLASGVDAVVHAAWDLTGSVATNPASVFEDNLMATTRLLEACRRYGVPKFAYVSTCAVYGASSDTSEVTEPRPATINGITKLLNERIIGEACAKAGMSAQIFRVFNMYGGRDRFSILSHLARALRDDVPFTLNNHGAAERDFVHVDDVAAIIGRLLPLDLSNVPVNIGSGRATRIADVVAVVKRLRPGLRIEHRDVVEVPSSRADLTRLSALIGPQQFVDVIDYVTSTFDPDG